MTEKTVRIDGPRGARPIEFGEVLDFQNYVFRCQHGSYPSMAGEMPHLYRESNSNNLRIIRENGKIKGCVCIYPAHIQWDDAVLKIGGIGGVSTHPESRGRGYARMLLDDCINVMTEEDYDVSILWGIRKLYQKFGWEESGILWRFQTADSNIGLLPEAPGGEILTDPQDQRLLAGACELHAAMRRGVVRDRELSDIMMNIVAYSQVMMLLQDDKPVAYIVYRQGRDLHVCDYGGDPAVVLGLARKVVEETGSDSFQIHTPKDDDGVAAYLIEQGFFCYHHYNGMILVLRPQKVLDAYGIDDMQIVAAGDEWDVTYAGETIRYTKCEISKLLFGPERKIDGHRHPKLPIPVYYGMIDHM